MKPTDTGHLHDKIVSWWNDLEGEGRVTISLRFVRAAIELCANKGSALDVGCGTGGRIIDALSDAGFLVTGIDISEAMTGYARERHPDSRFILGDICEWQPREQYDAIIAWDSTFHAPR